MLRAMTRVPGHWLVVLLALAVASCSGTMAPRELTAQDKSEIEQRVRARWQTLSTRDFEKSWDYTTPAFREVFPKQLYINKFSYAVEWELTAVEIINYDVDAAVVSVAVRVMSKPTKLTSQASQAIGAVPLTFRERWIYVAGEWWYSANA